MADEHIVETYLDQLGYKYSLIAYGMWRVKSDDVDNIIVSFVAPLVVIRLKVAAVPTGKDLTKLYEALLRANTELTHGAFALEDGFIVIVDTLEADTLDPNELASSIEGAAFAAATMFPRLKGLL
jgi:hypothetical protein